MSGPGSGLRSDAAVGVGPIVDLLSTEEGTVVLVGGDTGHHVVRVSELGRVVLELLAAGPLTVRDVAAHLVDLFGAPPGQDPVEATRQALDDMSGSGLVRPET
jgi:hypothetical protein